ncbi:unnamed protein product [Schistosoma rodhaini]|uniref:Uncharacterized protein n=1 Tax=Schistosoma rodhaini TaxID=6188 RepID=A0AA85GDV4_9TREM|nr:unnamed protein product [Schistosoma rodhaini]
MSVSAYSPCSNFKLINICRAVRNLLVDTAVSPKKQFVIYRKRIISNTTRSTTIHVRWDILLFLTPISWSVYVGFLLAIVLKWTRGGCDYKVITIYPPHKAFGSI